MVWVMMMGMGRNEEYWRADRVVGFALTRFMTQNDILQAAIRILKDSCRCIFWGYWDISCIYHKRPTTVDTIDSVQPCRICR